MDKDDILAFGTLAACLSFTKAAERLYITQSSLSKKIARLEKELGAELFFRNRHTVSLTPAGRVLYQECDGFLQSLERLTAEVREAGKGKEMRLRIAILGTGLARQFLPRLQAFEKNHPDIHVDYSFMSFHEIYYALDTMKIDAALTSDLGLSTIPGVETKEWGRSTNVLVLPAKRAAEKINFSLLQEETFFVLSSKSSDRALEMLKTFSSRWGFHPRNRRQLEAIDEILFLVEAGQGVAILPSFDVPKDNPNLFVHPLPDEALDTPIVLAWNGKNKNPALLIISEGIGDKG